MENLYLNVMAVSMISLWGLLKRPGLGDVNNRIKRIFDELTKTQQENEELKEENQTLRDVINSPKNIIQINQLIKNNNELRQELDTSQKQLREFWSLSTKKKSGEVKVTFNREPPGLDELLNINRKLKNNVKDLQTRINALNSRVYFLEN